MSDCIKTLQENGLEVIDVHGYIKWFDPSKGYGFIVQDYSPDDILLHATVLREFGHQSAYEGARVHCYAMKRKGGLQAFKLLSMDESTAIRTDWKARGMKRSFGALKWVEREGSVSFHNNFHEMTRIEQMDALKDWASDIENKYNELAKDGGIFGPIDEPDDK
jgi:cold shock CspA family protein